MATQRKGDVAARVAAKLGGSRSQGHAALNAVLSSIREAVSVGDRVVQTAFGTFESRWVRERTVRAIRGPRQGQLVTVPSHRRVGFSASPLLTSAVRGRS